MNPFPEMNINELSKTLSLTIKHDHENKVVAFLAMLSAYTDESQINISFNAPSSSGKTYLATEVAKLFPAEDKIELSGASPSSFYYGESEMDEETKTRIVDLERKILIFYEQPNPLLQEKLRAVLSHDQRELVYQITNKGKSGQNRAERIIIRGFPSTVFCSAGQKFDEQEATRAILLSPEATEYKLQEGVNLQALRSADVSKFDEMIETNPERQLLMQRIVAIRDEHVDQIIVPYKEEVLERFQAMAGALKPRHMRDINHLMSLIKAIALLNVWHRRKNGIVVAAQQDVDQAFKLWQYFVESTQLGISPSLLNFYKDFILGTYTQKLSKLEQLSTFEREVFALESTGISRYELNQFYLHITQKPLQDHYLRKEILPQLENCGLIQQGPPNDGGDRRSRYIYPLMLLGDTQNNKGKRGVSTPDDEKAIIIDKANKFFPS